MPKFSHLPNFVPFLWQSVWYWRLCNLLSIFSSEPGVANEILENEPKSCLTVA